MVWGKNNTYVTRSERGHCRTVKDLMLVEKQCVYYGARLLFKALFCYDPRSYYNSCVGSKAENRIKAQRR